MYLLKPFLHLTELFSCALRDSISVLFSVLFPCAWNCYLKGFVQIRVFGMGSLQAKWLFSQNHFMQVLLLQR